MDHVIYTGHWMLKFVSNIKTFLLLCFFNVAVKCILGRLQDIDKYGWFQYRYCRAIHPSFRSSKKQESKQTFQNSTPISKFDNPSKWHNPHTKLAKTTCIVIRGSTKMILNVFNPGSLPMQSMLVMVHCVFFKEATFCMVNSRKFFKMCYLLMMIGMY